MDSSVSIPQTVRRPMQERGRRRFDAILDAAAQILVEVGLAGFTVHGVAARANTSIGSMYHFFPDGDTVLIALGERHVAALEAVMQGVRDTEDGLWSEAPLAEAINSILDPILGYMEAHPDLFVLAQSHHKQPQPIDCDPEGHGLDATAIQIFERFIVARSPGISLADRQLRARTVHSITEGVAMRAAHYSPPERSALLGELRVAVTAYLSSYLT